MVGSSREHLLELCFEHLLGFWSACPPSVCSTRGKGKGADPRTGRPSLVERSLTKGTVPRNGSSDRYFYVWLRCNFEVAFGVSESSLHRVRVPLLSCPRPLLRRFCVFLGCIGGIVASHGGFSLQSVCAPGPPGRSVLFGSLCPPLCWVCYVWRTCFGPSVSSGFSSLETWSVVRVLRVFPFVFLHCSGDVPRTGAVSKMGRPGLVERSLTERTGSSGRYPHARLRLNLWNAGYVLPVFGVERWTIFRRFDGHVNVEWFIGGRSEKLTRCEVALVCVVAGGRCPVSSGPFVVLSILGTRRVGGSLVRCNCLFTSPVNLRCWFAPVDGRKNPTLAIPFPVL